jgi:type III pantothenate kinase
VYAEALASGLPAIGSRVGGVSDIVVDGVTGLLCDPDDPASLVDAVQHVLSMTDREWTDLVEAGQRHAADLHDAPTNAERLTEAVRALVDGHRAVREGSGSRAHRR